MDASNKDPVPVIVVGNKSDLSDQRAVSYEEGEQVRTVLPTSLICLYHGCVYSCCCSRLRDLRTVVVGDGRAARRGLNETGRLGGTVWACSDRGLSTV